MTVYYEVFTLHSQAFRASGFCPVNNLYDQTREGRDGHYRCRAQESFGQLGRRRVVNDMSIQVATVNGSGSQSSNTVLLRSIFQMGVPISGKNLFPSNIAGLPTWYTIRANKDGYIARKKEIDLLIAMNAETAQDDVKTLGPNAAVLYDEPLGLDKVRADLIYYAVPFEKLAATVGADAKLRMIE